MFRHRGKNRTFIHNLRLAILLSLVAGIVNSVGVLSIRTLTTNVTGHFAYFAEEFMKENYAIAITFFVLTLFFLMGAFTSNFIAEVTLKIAPNFAHVIPITLEMTLLFCIAIIGKPTDLSTVEGKTIAFGMLFAMGIQNALVTKISQSTVRTTHLTGLFTDLGIELSQLFFYKKPDEVKRLRTNIFLRLSIITFFFIGCFLGGFAYSFYKMKTLLIAVFFLLIALLYDYFRLKILEIKRRTFSA